MGLQNHIYQRIVFKRSHGDTTMGFEGFAALLNLIKKDKRDPKMQLL